MKNKLFTFFIWSSLVLTMVFLAGPLVGLIIKGANYVVPAFQSEEIRFAIRLSIKTSIISTIICLIVSIPASYAIYKSKTNYKNILKNIIYTPMSLPHLVSGIALLLFFGNQGLGPFLAKHLNLDFVFTASGIILAQVFVNLSFSIQLILNSLEQIDPKTIFVSRTLGCDERDSFIHIILPSLKRGIMSSAVMNWSRALGEFGAVMMLAGTTRMKTEVLPTAIYLNMATGNLNLAIGTSVILISISLLCMGIFNLLTKEKGRV